jgi:hypothetical protein
VIEVYIKTTQKAASAQLKVVSVGRISIAAYQRSIASNPLLIPIVRGSDFHRCVPEIHRIQPASHSYCPWVGFQSLLKPCSFSKSAHFTWKNAMNHTAGSGRADDFLNSWVVSTRCSTQTIPAPDQNCSFKLKDTGGVRISAVRSVKVLCTQILLPSSKKMSWCRFYFVGSAQALYFFRSKFLYSVLFESVSGAVVTESTDFRTYSPAFPKKPQNAKRAQIDPKWSQNVWEMIWSTRKWSIELARVFRLRRSSLALAYSTISQSLVRVVRLSSIINRL